VAVYWGFLVGRVPTLKTFPSTSAGMLSTILWLRDEELSEPLYSVSVEELLFTELSSTFFFRFLQTVNKYRQWILPQLYELLTESDTAKKLGNENRNRFSV